MKTPQQIRNEVEKEKKVLSLIFKCQRKSKTKLNKEAKSPTGRESTPQL